MACWSLMAAWASDCIDGPLARRSRVQYRNWIGDHDLEIDVSVALGLLIYMLSVGYVDIWLGLLYLLVWIVALWHFGLPASLGKLFQALIYGWFILVAVREEPFVGLWLLMWIFVAIIVTWPRFPDETIPEFLDGMEKILKSRVSDLLNSHGAWGAHISC